MSSRASKSASAFGPYGAGESYDHEELWPGERIGTPLPRRGSKALLRGMFLLIVLGGGWALLNYRPALPDWASIETTVSAWINRNGAGPVERADLAMATASPPAHSVPPAKPLDTPLPSPPPPAPSSATAAPSAVEKSALVSPPPAAARPDEAQAGPLPPPAADPADPYRIRAEAVGLHPDLSRVLLDRLSPTDYRNAGIAIKTALAETPDSAVFVFPRQRKPELALFRVHFVPGAAPGCRRYVVAITKDGWLTTALPMEKCGPQTKRARRD
jgi:hypothetical protein